MQHVNDDMDEVFRRAAKDYPLNTGGADWEKVQKALEEPPAGAEGLSGKNNRRHFLWLLLLLPLPWICTHYYSGEERGTAETPGVQKEVPGVQQKEDRSVEGYTLEPMEEKGPSAEPGGQLKAQESSSSFPTTSKVSKGNAVGTGETSTHIRAQAAVSKALKRDNQAVAYSETREDIPRVATASKNKEDAERLTEATQTIPVKPVDTAVTADKTQEATLANKDLKDTTATTPSAEKKQTPTRTKRFYAGIIGGADITSIEMQKVKKVGYDLGLVAGYAINKKWSVEAGLLSSEKAYYSSGEHLYKAYLIPGTKLLEAEGDCRMWEVPLVVRYRFNADKRSGWVVSAGSSSYFMKEEAYDYTYYYTTTGQEVKRSRSYNSDSRHLFAAAQFSGGYNRRIGKSMEVRVEPYLKLPLRKVGYYELPLTSFGIHAGITRKLF